MLCNITLNYFTNLFIYSKYTAILLYFDIILCDIMLVIFLP